MSTRSIKFQVDPAQIEEVVRRVFREMQSTSCGLNQNDLEIEMVKHQPDIEDETSTASIVATDPETRRLRETLQRIMSKEFISAKEAAVLLNCSERHIHNLVDRARDAPLERPTMVSAVLCRRTRMGWISFLDVL